jgi:hypothetical protein
MAAERLLHSSSAHVARPEHTPAAPLRSTPQDAGDAHGHRVGLYRQFILHRCRSADLVFQVPPHSFGPAVGTGDPGGSARVETVHKGTAYPGEHRPIITRELWDKVHAILQESPRKRAAKTRGYNTPAPLKGLLFGPDNRAFTPAYTRRRNRLYRYYTTSITA